jgi:hypothetical protein
VTNDLLQGINLAAIICMTSVFKRNLIRFNFIFICTVGVTLDRELKIRCWSIFDDQSGNTLNTGERIKGQNINRNL